jgi:gamma-glutamylcyclotransferase (GGCT)/AIG2-like uncharacterized protein YtfP
MLFVYGTLMRGGDIHDLLKHRVDLLGKAKMRGALYWFRAENYPGAVVTYQPDRFVHGELYRLLDPSKILPILDKAEGCKEGLFERRPVDVIRNGRKIRAWAYLYARSPGKAQLIPSGNFLQLHATA